jgi:hypothetical protein
MTTPALSPTQHAILDHAHRHTDGKITWFPDNIKGGARQKVLSSLLKRALITPLGEEWFIAAQGYDALGQPRPDPITLSKLDAVIANAQAAPPLTEAHETGVHETDIHHTEAHDDPQLQAAVVAIEASAKASTSTTSSTTATAPTPRTRDNSKQAQVLAMLKRPEGATIVQICEVTGWQQHTVRGAFAGAFKKKLGLEITSTKQAGGQRVYRAV